MITYGSTTLTSYNSIVNTEVYYYKSTSATELIGGTWSTEKPEWEDGKYIWQKIRTLYEDNTTSESDPVNITGQQGKSGISYKLSSSNTIIVKDKDGQLKVNSVTFSASVIQGSGNVESYNGRFIIEKYDGTQWVEEIDYTSIEDENVKIYTIPIDISNIRCSLYQAGGFTELIDQITIPIIADGTDAVGLVENIPIYLASNKESGVTIFDEGWTRFKPELTSEDKYLWMYYVSRYAKGDTAPQLIEVQGSTVNFENHGETSPLEQVIIDINYVQEGDGDPSPENIRPITGWDAINIISGNAPIHSYENNKYELNLSDSLGIIDEDTLEITDTTVTVDGNIIILKDSNLNIAINFPESIGTVYGGSLNVTTGVLTVTYGYIDSYAGETINGVWVSDRDVYVEGTVPTTGAQVIYVLDTPIVYNLAPREVLGVYGINNMQADTGNMHISYYDNQTISTPFVDYALTSTIEMSEAAISKVKAVYGTCSTLNSIAIKNVKCDNFELYIGARIQVIFEDSNTVTQVIYLNVNNTSPLEISIQNEPVSATNQLIWSANTTLEFIFDGVYWQLQNAPFNLSGTSESMASDVNKLVTCGHSVICKGTLLSVYMENTNTNANTCLNVDSTIPSIIYANGEPLSVNSRFNWRAETTQNFIFDGQVWRMDDDSVKALATAYITEIDDDGIMVHPEDDSTSGWAISDAIQLFKNGISYIKLWIENNIPKIRIGKEDQGHIILDNDSVDVRNGDNILASFGEDSFISSTRGTKIQINGDDLYGVGVDGGKTFEISNNGYVEENIKIQEEVCNVDIDDNAIVGNPYRIVYNIPHEMTSRCTITLSSVAYPKNGTTAWGGISQQFREGTSIGGVLINNDHIYAGFGYNGDSRITLDYYKKITDEDVHRFRVYLKYHGNVIMPYYTFGTRDLSNAKLGKYSFTAGKDIVGSGAHAHGEGLETTASGSESHAEGNGAKASGASSHAQNHYTIAGSDYQTALGKYNREDSDDWYAVIIGNGMNASSRSNALGITWDGNIDIALDINAASDTVDGKLYAAIHALGWDNGDDSVIIDYDN